MSLTDLFTQLVRAEIELWNSLERQLQAEAGISVATFQSLAAIGHADGSVRVQDISESMSITVGATSKLVDRLERDGLAAREPNPDDRRSSLIALTDAGRAALAVAERSVDAHLALILGETFGEDRLANITSELSALRSQVAAGPTL